MHAYQTIRYQRSEHVGTLSLARPRKHNAQNPRIRKTRPTVDDFNALAEKLAAYEARFGSIEQLAEEAKVEEAPAKVRAIKKSA